MTTPDTRLAGPALPPLKWHRYEGAYYAETRTGNRQLIDRTYWIRPEDGGWCVSWHAENPATDTDTDVMPASRDRLADAKGLAAAWHAARSRHLAEVAACG